MTSSTIQEFHRRMVKRRGGAETVKYIPFAGGTGDALTGGIDESTAYTADPVSLPALIDLNPSRALREKIGLEINFDAVVRIAAADLSERSIEIRVGDVLDVSADGQRYYVKKAYPDMQLEGSHLEMVVAVSRKVGRRG